MDTETLKEELERAIKIYKPDGEFDHDTLFNIASHFAQWGHDKTMEKMPKWRPAARAYLGCRMPLIDYSLNRVVARDEDRAYYLTMVDLYRLPKDNDCHIVGSTMIQEEYVSFEVAKLLKEKGFDEPLYMTYWGDGTMSAWHIDEKNSSIHGGYVHYTAPTQQMAMRWLREVYKINIEVRMLYDRWDFCIQRIPNHEGAIYQADDIWESYESACNAALYYCLDNLIEVNEDDEA